MTGFCLICQRLGTISELTSVKLPGLGLSIAYQLLESYKGKITVESSLGQGTIFRIYVPIIESEQNSY